MCVSHSPLFDASFASWYNRIDSELIASIETEHGDFAKTTTKAPKSHAISTSLKLKHIRFIPPLILLSPAVERREGCWVLFLPSSVLEYEYRRNDVSKYGYQWGLHLVGPPDSSY